MHTRRNFVKLAFGGALGGSILLSSIGSAIQRAWAASRKVLPRGTKRESLIRENPAALDHQADFDRTAARVSIGAKGQKTARFPLDDVLSDKVFLAYQVNGTALPRKHGFPLRVVAEDYYGSDWVKYVDRIAVERT